MSSDGVSQRAAGRRRVAVLGLGGVVVVAAKLWLVAPAEVAARANPYDQLLYAELASHLVEGRWLGPYGPRTLIRDPGYPLWLAAVDRSGLPLRVASELLLAAASLVFAAALLRVGVAAAAALACFGLLVLQPHSLLVHGELLPMGLYLPTLLVGLAGLLLAVRARSPGWRAAHAAWAGLALGLMWITRPEHPLVLAALGAALGSEWAVRWRRGEGALAPLRDAALLAGVALVGAAAVVVPAARANAQHYGVALTSELQAPGYRAASRALLAIEQRAPRRYVPVPAEVRARAYAASPAFRSLRPYLEYEGWGHHASCVVARVCDDLAGGWFLWILREAAAGAGEMPDAPAADAFFQRIADELEGACERGVLACRAVAPTFLHPAPGTWLPSLPGSIGRVLRRMAAWGDARDWHPPGDPADLQPDVRRLFDEVANRRPHLASQRWAAVRGSVSADRGDPVTRISLRTAGGRTPLVEDAQAVAEAEGERARVPFGFRFELAGRLRERRQAQLLIERVSGASARVPLFAARDEPVERAGVRVEIDSFEPVDRDGSGRRVVRTGLWVGHALLLRVLALAGVGAGFALWRGRRRRLPLPLPWIVALVTLAVVVAGRVLVVALIDASSFPADHTRYVYPAASLAGCGLVLLVHAAVRAQRA